jgi:diguanylate cyclase (GGDEF)-like protein
VSRLQSGRALGAAIEPSAETRPADVLGRDAPQAVTTVDVGLPVVDARAPDAVLQTLVNVGVLHPGEERWPVAEYYPMADFPKVSASIQSRDSRSIITTVGDAGAGSPEAALLERTGRAASLTAPMLVNGEPWGELWVARGSGGPAFTDGEARTAEEIAALLAAGLVHSQAWRELKALAWSDALTGVANRRAFDERVAEILSSADAVPLTVVIADVNGLKEINDAHGHEAGDQALRRVARHAATVVTDVPGATAARLGGDEFALALPNLGPRRAYRLAAAWCLLAMEDEPAVSLACGLSTRAERVAVEPQRVSEVRAALVRAADVAAYEAKRGRVPYPLWAEPPAS